MYRSIGLATGDVARLLDDYMARSRRFAPGALAATAVRTGSVAARQLPAGAAGSEAHQLPASTNTGSLLRVSADADPHDVADLARVMALQDCHPDDLGDSLALFEALLERFGPDRIPSHYQHLHAQLAYHVGDRGRAGALLNIYQRIGDRARRTLQTDLANPFAGDTGSSTEEWLRLFRDLWFPKTALGLEEAADEGVAPFDRVSAHAEAVGHAGERVSVIVTSFKPSLTALETAIRSLVRQTWRDLEIIVVDDASPPEFDPVLRHCVGLDERVRLVRLPTNGGTYRARNAGLDAATGAFVTFQDCDDWSHPLRVEHQVRPLLDDPELMATLTEGLRVSEDLTATRLGRPSLFLNTSSLLIRTRPALEKIGYFDSVRKSADTEYQKRLEVVFGVHAVQQLRGEPYALIRQDPQSLSHSDFRPGWIHPARAAYQSAYARWHQRIAAGAADPYVPTDLRVRDFAAPAHIREGEAGPERAYDVIFVGDWRQYGGPQKSMIEEIRALVGRGLRVGVMQMEAFRFMTRERKHLCAPIQDLINNGTVDHVLRTDNALAELLIVRYPPVLQFPPPTIGVRAQQVIILANQVPSERDGTDLRYLPEACTNAARELFSAEPRWCPQGPQVREVLQGMLDAEQLTPFDMPGILDPAEWSTHRDGFRSSIPVIGRHSRDSWVKWPVDADTLLQVCPGEVCPGEPDVDVRIMGGAEVPRSLLGSSRVPSNWLVYSYDEVGVRSFLYQLDFYVYFPHPQWVEAFGRAVLEALAVGCVTVLPKPFEATFSDAAIYCEPSEVRDVVKRYSSDAGLFLQQSRKAMERVGQWFSHEAYADLVESLLVGPRPAAVAR